MDLKEILNMQDYEGKVMLMDAIYDEGESYKDEDSIMLLFKNVVTQEKFIKIIKNPLMEGYIAKDNVKINYNMTEIPVDEVEMKDFHYKNILKELAEEIGQDGINYFWNCIKNKNRKELNEIQSYPRFFSTDRNIEDFYRYKCLDTFGRIERYKLTKGYLDIEADTLNHWINLKDSQGDAPVNAVTIIDGERMTSYTLLLRNSENPQIAKFEKNIHEFINGLNEEFDPIFGHIDYKIKMFDSEIELIEMIFTIIHAIKLDFLLIWNMAFDIRYLMYRIIALGRRPEEIMCDPSVPIKICKYHHDEAYKVGKRSENFDLSGYTKIICQMVNYGCIRKSQPEIDSFKLDFIGEKVAGFKKLNYEKAIGATIRTLPWKDYAMFVKYNIRDVLVQKAVEDKTNDVLVLFENSYSMATRYSKVYKETVFLTNVAFMEWKEQGLILGNNVNKLKRGYFKEDLDIDENGYDIDTDDDSSGGKKTKYDGALVGDPTLNTHQGIMINGKRSKSIMGYTVDYDYTSMYPTANWLFNIYGSTQVGRIYMDPMNITDREYGRIESNYDRGGTLLDDYELHEPILYMYTWNKMPSASKILKDFGDELAKNNTNVLKIRRTEDNIRKLKCHKIVDVKYRQISFKRMVD